MPIVRPSDDRVADPHRCSCGLARCVRGLLRHITSTLAIVLTLQTPLACYSMDLFVSQEGLHHWPYTNWTDAATNVQAAVDSAQSGDMVWVTNGVYTVRSAVALTNGITITSVNGRDSVTLDGQRLTRVVFMDHPDAVLRGITLANGWSTQYGGGIMCLRGRVEECHVRNSEAFGAGGIACGTGGVIADSVIASNTVVGLESGGAGGILCDGGRVERCTVRDNIAINSVAGGVGLTYSGALVESTVIGNRAAYGAGVASMMGGRVDRCTITENVADDLAGGLWIWESDATSSIITGNIAETGGGVYIGPIAEIGASGSMYFADSRLLNCTVVNNTASVAAGGVMCSSNAVIGNSIIWTNAAPLFANVATGTPETVFLYTCTTPLLPGTGNIANDPQFVAAAAGNYRLSASSPCIDVGTASDAPNRDLDGVPRPLDGDGDGVAAVDIGAYEYDIPRSNTHYVFLSGEHIYPYTNWQNAATNIQDAVDAADGGATVLVSAGTYALENEVTVETNIVVQSVHGAAATVIDGCHTTRCFRLLPDAGCLVRGFSITNGLVGTNEYGGGVWLGSGNVLADCVIANCEAWAGGGVYATDAVVSNCTFFGNVAEWAGGGLVVSPNGRGFLIDGCTFTANTADAGGGVFCGSLSNSVEAVQSLMAGAVGFLGSLAGLDNIAQNLTNILSDLATGPGPLPPPDMSGSPGRPEIMRVPCDVNSASNVIRGCSVTGNTALCGGGFFLLDCPDTVVSNCTLAANEAECGGGLSAANGGIMCESTVSDNHAYLLGGGILAWEGTKILNCHVNSNSAVNAAGGCWLAFSGVSVLAGGGTTHEMTGGGPAALRVAGSEFVGNDGGMLGGGLFLGDGIAVSNTFFQNSAMWGGGIANLGGSVSASVVVENSADVGGGILNGGAVSSCVIRYNSADIGGGVASVPFFTGGIAVWPSPPGDSPVADCDVSQNVALGGGGVALLDAGPLTACTVASNSAGMAGGGVLTILRSEIHSSLVHGNRAGDGAGIYCLNGGDTIQCTVTANDAAYSGGGLFVVTNETGFGGQYETDAFVGNSIVHGNSASNAPNFLNLASNVVYSYTCISPAIPGTGNITNSPLFADAAARDYHLQPSSPCIDAGNNGLMPSGTDLDGLSRPLDGDNDGTATVDMGCYEHLNSTADSDGDTMPDGWEFDHGLNLVADDSGQDADNDTLNNGGEYAADTDPQDGDSVLSILDISPEMGGIRLDWKGGREAWQILECRENLDSTTEQWTAIFALPPPTPITNALIHFGVTNRAFFYRVRAER